MAESVTGPRCRLQEGSLGLQPIKFSMDGKSTWHAWILAMALENL
jgi:hypothetical protein